MPVIHTRTSATVTDEQREALKSAYGQIIECVPGKSEQWLMCLFDDDVPMSMAGRMEEPCAYVTVDVFARSAIDPSVWQEMTPQVCDLLQSVLGIDPARVYIKYGYSADFGWNGMNF